MLGSCDEISYKPAELLLIQSTRVLRGSRLYYASEIRRCVLVFFFFKGHISRRIAVRPEGRKGLKVLSIIYDLLYRVTFYGIIEEHRERVEGKRIITR